jgi:O-methyltransferase
MFYGIPTSRLNEMQQAMTSLADIFKGQFYSNDMLITIGRNMSFKRDKKFMSSFSAGASSEQEQSLLWRLHTLAWAAKNALKIKGDFVECGVYKGFCSGVLFDYLEFQDLPRQAYLYDTFDGLPEETSTEAERVAWNYKQDDKDAVYLAVCEKFSKFDNVHVVRGTVPDSFNLAVPDEIAFLHIDMNSEQAEMLALEHLFDKVTPGGFIVLDDFGWMSNRNQMSAELAFMNERGQHVMELPTGQGLVIKMA